MVMQELNLKKFMAKIALDHYKEFQESFETLKPLAKSTGIEYGRELPAQLIKNKCNANWWRNRCRQGPNPDFGAP